MNIFIVIYKIKQKQIKFFEYHSLYKRYKSYYGTQKYLGTSINRYNQWHICGEGPGVLNPLDQILI